jgi:hypothetical protein
MRDGIISNKHRRKPAQTVTRRLALFLSIWRQREPPGATYKPLLLAPLPVRKLKRRAQVADVGYEYSVIRRRHGTKVPGNGRERSIATEPRCPRDVRSSHQFRHNLVAPRVTMGQQQR